jgi:hypothetical protein
VTVTMEVIVVMILEVTVGIHLYFREVGQRKKRGLYPPFGWNRRIRKLELP